MNFRKSFKRPLTGLLLAEYHRSWASWGPLKLLVWMYGNITGNIQDIYGNSSSTWIEHYQLMLDMFQKKRRNSNIAGQQLKAKVDHSYWFHLLLKPPWTLPDPCATRLRKDLIMVVSKYHQNAISHHKDFIILSYPVKRTYCRRLPKSAPRPPPPARRGMASRRGTAGGTTMMKERKKTTKTTKYWKTKWRSTLTKKWILSHQIGGQREARTRCRYSGLWTDRWNQNHPGCWSLCPHSTSCKEIK